MLALDFDGVVANAEPVLLKYIEDKTGMKYTPPEGVRSHELKKGFCGVDRTVLTRYINECLCEKPGSYFAWPYDITDTLHALSLIQRAFGKVTFVTSRMLCVERSTKKWINYWFGKLNNTVYCIQGIPKDIFLKSNGFSAIIEDRLRTANHCADAGLHTYLIRRPWNVNRPTHDKVIVVGSLLEAVEDYLKR